MSTPSSTGNMKPKESAVVSSGAAVPAPAPAQAAPAPKPSSAPTAPPGFKLVKVKKPDGSIVTVKRKLSPEEAASASASAATAQPASKPDEEAFKIVTVRQPDGSLVKVRRAIKKDEATPTSTPRKDSNEVPPPAPTTKPADADKSQPQANKDVKEPGAPEIKAAVAPVDQSKAKATAPATNNLETEKSAPVSAASPPTEADPAAFQAALDEQERFFRDRKRHQFKTKLLRGVGAIAAAAVPTIEIGDHFMDGDEILSDSDWSVDEDDDHDGGDHDDMSEAADDLHHGAQDGHSQTADDDDKTLEHDGNDSAGHNISIDAGAAVQGAAMAAAAAGGQPAQRQPLPATATPAAAAAGDKAATANEKVTYKITAKELNEMEDKTAEKVSRPLKKHWANLTFYIMASLSIVLPLLFLLLGLFVILMKGKHVDSHWGAMQDAIKIAISAWPIVFAAVTAQVFKAWATYKVERGIKLMELEQLIGSNSFGSAIKQPFLLRRVDLLTLLLLVVWCLSPIGSQALQRTYTIGPEVVNATMPVLYLDMTSTNRFFSFQSLAQNIHANQQNDVMQKMTNLYLATFLPEVPDQNPYEDYWHHPRSPWLNHSAIDAPMGTSYYGVPMIITKSVFPPDYMPDGPATEGNLRWERLNFPLTSAFFDFQCGDWSVVNGTYFNETNGIASVYSWDKSLSGSAHYLFYSNNASAAEADPTGMSTTYDRMKFASVITKGSAAEIGGGAQVTFGDEAQHVLIDCSFEQKFVDYNVECYTDSSRNGGMADCYEEGDTGVETPPGNLRNTSGAKLFSGFGKTFAENTSPYHTDGDLVATPNEIFFGLYSKEDSFDKYQFNLSSMATPADFGRRMSYLFNTWIDLGNSVHYLTYWNETQIQPGEEGEFVRVDAQHVYTTGRVYFISVGWVVGYFLCAGALLIAGTLSVVVESMTVAPDVLGYVSTVARNSKYLQLPKTNSAMSGGERARVLGGTKVMMQDVKAKADIGRIALGLKHEKAEPLKPGRLYR